MVPIRLLVVNPNTSVSMTESLKPLVARATAGSPGISCDFFTAPSPDTPHPGALPSINSPSDAILSTSYCLPFISPLVPSYDGILVACYSEHPLVRMLGELVGKLKDGRKRYVTGIFEASVLASLALLAQLPSSSKFGIVSTGSVWGPALADAARLFLGGGVRFASCETTGLNADELHELPPATVRAAIVDATARLLQQTPAVRVVCMGCAGMAGLEDVIREGALRALGERGGAEVRIVDGIVAGVGWLVAACKSGF